MDECLKWWDYHLKGVDNDAMATPKLRVYVQDSMPPASGVEMEHFYTHLEQALQDIGFLNPENPRHLMRRLRRLFIRARPDQNEVNILRGILTAVDRIKNRSGESD